MRTWIRAAELLAFFSVAAVGCQYVAGLDEDRSTQRVNPNGIGGIGGEGGQGGDSGHSTSRPCAIETAGRASQTGSGETSLAYAAGAYHLVWPHFQDGVATSTVDATGDLASTEDTVLLAPQVALLNGHAVVAPFGDQLLVGVSRFDPDPGENYPALFTVDAESGTPVDMSDTESFPSSDMAEAASLVVTDDLERVLMVMRPLGEGPTELRRFTGSLTQHRENTITNTLDAAATWSKELDRFAVFVTERDDRNKLKLYTFPPDAEAVDALVAQVNKDKETPDPGVFQHGLSAAAANGRFFVAWTDQRYVGESGVYLASVDQSGERERDAVWVSDEHPGVAVGAPNLIFDGKQLVVLYRTEQRLYMRRFTPDLEPIGGEEFLAWLDDAGTDRAAIVAGAPGVFGVAYLDPETREYFVFQRIVCDDP